MSMNPLNVHKTESDFYGDETLELKLQMNTYIHEGRLREYPAESRDGICEHLIFKLKKLIGETDFSNIVVIEQKWDVPIILNGKPVGIATFNSREDIETALVAADCVLAPETMEAIEPGDMPKVVALNMFPAQMHASHG